MEKKNLIIYRVVTGLFTLLTLFAAFSYFFNYEMVEQMFTQLGFPTYIIYPLGVAKILGLVAIWTRKSKFLKEWAYAGYVFDLLLASSAHFNVGDGGFAPALVVLVLVIGSYVYDQKVYGSAVLLSK